jgi:glutathione S-transferase
MKLYVLPPSPRAIKVIAVAAHLNIGCEIHALDYSNAEQSSPAFRRLNPNGRQPVLEDDDGWVLWESNAIVFDLALRKPEAGLWPSARRSQADVMRWLAWESSHWDPAWDLLITERLKKQYFITGDSGRHTSGRAERPQAADPERIAEGERYLRELAPILDSHLIDRAWLVGEKPTIADFVLAAWIPVAGSAGFPMDHWAAIMRWYRSVSALPGWGAALSS